LTQLDGKNVGGRPKGRKNDATLNKELAREALRQIVLREMDEMAAAQIAHAKGIKYLVTRNAKTGKFERVSKERMEALLDADDVDTLETVEVWEKDPSTQAFTDLMNRALDKPKEQEQVIELKGSVELVERLQAARQRLAKRQNS
jgi:hypothetical protein